MKRPLISIIKFVAYFILVIILVIIPELVGGDISDFLKDKLGDNYKLVLLPLGFGAALIITLWDHGRNFFKKKEKEVPEQNVSIDNIIKIRAGLSESYQKRLDNKMASRFPINLELSYDTEGTTTKASLYDNKTIRSTRIKEELTDLFDKHRGRLLIIGGPGSGKTTLLIQLAIKLLERQQSQIPVIIDLATWRSRFSSIEDWLTELLPQMGFSKALTRQLLIENRFLPLFDGLDELAEEDRKACLEAIGEYGRLQDAHYVICSRINEYIGTTDAPVYCQVRLKTLTLSQIKTGLKGIGSPETKGVLNAIKKDPLLGEAIKTPFYLNTVQLLFASMKSWEELEFKNKILEGRKKEIVEKFIEESSGNFDKYQSNQVKKWLAFLAKRMDKEKLVTFELINLQYDWISLRKWQFFVIKLLFGLIDGFTISLMVGFIIGLIVGLVKGPVQGFFFGLTAGIIRGIMVGSLTTQPIILTKDRINPRSKRATLIFFIVDIIFFLIWWIFMNWAGKIGHASMAVIIGGLVFILILGLDILNNDSQYFLKVSHPYQRFKASISRLYFSVILYWYLKHLLYRKGLLPKLFVNFLKKATSNNILESDGGTWRFRHRILQDYFVVYWRKNFEKEKPRNNE